MHYSVTQWICHGRYYPSFDYSYIKACCHGNEVQRGNSLGKAGQHRQQSCKPEMKCEMYARKMSGKKPRCKKKEVLLKINCMKDFRKHSNRCALLSTLHRVNDSLTFSRKTV